MIIRFLKFKNIFVVRNGRIFTDDLKNIGFSAFGFIPHVLG